MNYPGYSLAFSAPKTFSQSTPSRALNTVFMVSATRWSWVEYSVTLSASTSATLTGTSTGTATCNLQIRPVGGAFVNKSTAAVTNSTTFALLVGITVSTTDTKTIPVSCFVPPNYEIQLVTSTTGTASATITASQQEVIYG